MRTVLRLAMILTMIAAPIARVTNATDSPRPHIELARIAGPERVAFLTKFFYKHYPEQVNWSLDSRRRGEENWTRVVRDEAYVAEVDLNDDGVPELIVVIDDPNWCDSAGCLSAIFRKNGNRYDDICQTSLPGPGQPGAEILAEIENGYHRIATPARLIEWNATQENDSGTLCSTDGPSR